MLSLGSHGERERETHQVQGCAGVCLTVYVSIPIWWKAEVNMFINLVFFDPWPISDNDPVSATCPVIYDSFGKLKHTLREESQQVESKLRLRSAQRACFLLETKPFAVWRLRGFPPPLCNFLKLGRMKWDPSHRRQLFFLALLSSFWRARIIHLVIMPCQAAYFCLWVIVEISWQWTPFTGRLSFPTWFLWPLCGHLPAHTDL